MKHQLRFQDFADRTSVQKISTEQLKHIKGGGGFNSLPNGLENFPDQAKGCPPPLEFAS